MRERVLVGMSGGVDSSVSVAVLRKEGYGVVGLTMKLYEGEEESWGGKSCCTLGDIFDARNVACKLGIEHYVEDMVIEFGREVI